MTIPGMTSLRRPSHSSAAQSPKGDIEPNHPSEINPKSREVRVVPAVCAIPGRPVS